MMKKDPLHVRNEPTYKENWGALSGNFKNVFNYVISIGHSKNILIHDSSRQNYIAFIASV
jgi:hypothetical protein